MPRDRDKHSSRKNVQSPQSQKDRHHKHKRRDRSLSLEREQKEFEDLEKKRKILENLRQLKKKQEEEKKKQHRPKSKNNEKSDEIKNETENNINNTDTDTNINTNTDTNTNTNTREVNDEKKEDEIDPLDAFMYSEVIPEVLIKEKEERDKYQAEKLEKIKKLSEGKANKVPKILDDSDSDDHADLEVQIPTNKVKLVVGPSGTKIQEIQKKSKCRIQIKKPDSELNKAFGSGPQLIKPILINESNVMTTLLIFGDKKGLECAKKLIEETVENKDQKQKQRVKEYEKKKEAKRRERQMYHLRHSRDYEVLGLPMGASKAEVKAAYKKLVLVWHPDKQQDKSNEVKMKNAKETFSEIQRAYQSLMLTDEDEIIKQIGR